jgi:quinol monooxygenase YgiN
VEQIFVFSIYHARPGKEEFVGSAFREMAIKVREEPGCRSLHIYKSAPDPGQFLVCACWIDKTSLDAFLELPYVVRFLDQIQPLIDSPLDVKLMHQFV